MAYIVTCKGEERNIGVEERHPGLYTVHLGGKEYLVDYHESRDNLLSLIIDGKSYEVDIEVSESGEMYGVDIQGDHFELEVVEEKKKKLARKLSAAPSGRQEIRSPMSGNVCKILVKQGQPVEPGQVLMILEAMKMMNEIKATVAGVIGSLKAKEGVPVATNDLLCVVEPAE
ncbi:biotin/lipoyl-containing protein [Geomonas azotofigens]|uniref:biotin/lipoyl-containing protein n=1 Tax=Geomonas azotofigens TaxID=2843196 RepID=UPI001C113F76|nr:biotin/lipoyl-containing protein [Geomonas azotofigens]MBU5612865.1 biotin/lipoyl-binding protein [Geomonas azotofigens]